MRQQDRRPEGKPGNDQAIQFKDPNFLKELIAENVDTDGDGQISFDEAKAVTFLHVVMGSIKEMPEIRYFTALGTLYCSTNQLTTLDVSNNTDLTWLVCHTNQLTTLDVSNNTALTLLSSDIVELRRQSTDNT